MLIPDELSVRVRADRRPVAGALVWFRTFVAGQPYFEGLIGLTDMNGLAELNRERLLSTFSEAQEAFPMDYKVPLTDADDEIEVGVTGGREFIMERERADTPLLSPDARVLWSTACNHDLPSVRMRRPLLLVHSSSSGLDLDLSSR